MELDDTFFGVFNRKGELECVESGFDAAFNAARNLSPGSGGKPPLAPVGRTVEPVTVIRGDLGAFIHNMLELAASKQIIVLHEAYQKALKQATTVDDKTGNPVVVANSGLQEAKERLRTAINLQTAIVEGMNLS